VYQTLGTSQLRLATVDAVAPAERLQELVTPAQLHARFRQLQTICARLGVPMSAVAVRLEGLAQLREELGPGAAVNSLAAATYQLAAATREGDEIGRWSDDELALLCPGADSEALLQTAEALVAALEQVRVRHDLQDGVQITLPLRVSVRLIGELEEPETGFGEEDEAPPPGRHLHVA
jgi:GGDEF domain-containing protein